MSTLSKLAKDLHEANDYDLPPDDGRSAVGLGDLLVVADISGQTGAAAVRVVPYGAPPEGAVVQADSTSPTGWTVQAFVVENRTTDPASPAVGQLWFRTDLA